MARAAAKPFHVIYFIFYRVILLSDSVESIKLGTRGKNKPVATENEMIKWYQRRQMMVSNQKSDIMFPSECIP